MFRIKLNKNKNKLIFYLPAYCYVSLYFTVPAGLNPPTVDGFNSSTIMVAWNTPRQQNGPAPIYQAHRMVTSFNAAPPLVEKGSRFPGGGYYLFSNMSLPSSAYTGKLDNMV